MKEANIGILILILGFMASCAFYSKASSNGELFLVKGVVVKSYLKNNDVISAGESIYRQRHILEIDVQSMTPEPTEDVELIEAEFIALTSLGASADPKVFLLNFSNGVYRVVEIGEKFNLACFDTDPESMSNFFENDNAIVTGVFNRTSCFIFDYD